MGLSYPSITQIHAVTVEMEGYVIEEVNSVHVLMVTLAKYVNIVSPIISTPHL